MGGTAGLRMNTRGCEKESAMRKRLLGSIGALLAGAGLALAQPAASVPETKTQEPAKMESAKVDVGGAMPATFTHKGKRGEDGIIVGQPLGTVCDVCATGCGCDTY